MACILMIRSSSFENHKLVLQLNLTVVKILDIQIAKSDLKERTFLAIRFSKLLSILF